MFACRSLIQSSLVESFDFILLDSTAESIPAPGIVTRFLKASKRVLRFIYFLLVKKPDVALIFSSSGFSFLEKGLMSLLAKIFHVKSIFAPRSGLLIDNIGSSAFFRWFAAKVFSYTYAIIMQGKFWKEFYSSLSPAGNKDKYVIIPNWIDTGAYDSSGISRQANEIFTIIYVGWLEKYKGILDLTMSC